MLCSRASLVKDTASGEQVRPLPCRSWDCPRCGPQRQRQLIAIAMAGRANKMLTLTVRSSVGNSPHHRRELLHQAWRILHKRMARKLKVKRIPYLAFVEKTQAGEPHVHILLRSDYIHWKWIRNQMRQLIDSPMIWIDRIKNSRSAAYYVTKYCTKAPAKFGNLKRYWGTRDYNLDHRDPEEFRRADFLYSRIHIGRYTEYEYERLTQGWAFKAMGDGWVDWKHFKTPPSEPGYRYYSYASRELLIT